MVAKLGAKSIEDVRDRARVQSAQAFATLGVVLWFGRRFPILSGPLPPLLPGGVATVDKQVGAGHEGGFVAGQEDGAGGHFL